MGKGEVPDSLKRFIEDSRLKPEEQAALLDAAKAGDQGARARVVAANIGLVVDIAKTYRATTLPLVDLVQNGAIGLMMATGKFDPEKGHSFSSYATPWVRYVIRHGIKRRFKQRIRQLLRLF